MLTDTSFWSDTSCVCVCVCLCACVRVRARARVLAGECRGWESVASVHTYIRRLSTDMREAERGWGGGGKVGGRCRGGVTETETETDTETETERQVETYFGWYLRQLWDSSQTVLKLL